MADGHGPFRPCRVRGLDVHRVLVEVARLCFGGQGKKPGSISALERVVREEMWRGGIMRQRTPESRLCSAGFALIFMITIPTSEVSGRKVVCERKAGQKWRK